MVNLQEFGIHLTQILQTLSPTFDGLMNFFSFLGRIEFYLLFLSFIIWVIDSRLGIRMLLILLFTEVLGSNLKLLFHQPRPYWIGDVKALGEETSYGIPSTHASNTLAVWGYLGYALKKTWLWIVVVLLVLMIGISRIYLAVHFPHDVLFGWLIGAIMLWIFIKSEQPIITWAKQQSIRTLVGVAFLLSLVIILVGALVQLLIAGSPDPKAWSAFAALARTPTYSYTLAGALFGAISGYVLMKQHANFSCGGTWLRRVGRYAFGILGLLLIYFGLDVLFSLVAIDESIVGYALRYLRYAIATFWVTFIAPWIFLRIGLAEPSSG